MDPVASAQASLTAAQNYYNQIQGNVLRASSIREVSYWSDVLAAAEADLENAQAALRTAVAISNATQAGMFGINSLNDLNDSLNNASNGMYPNANFGGYNGGNFSSNAGSSNFGIASSPYTSPAPTTYPNAGSGMFSPGFGSNYTSTSNQQTSSNRSWSNYSQPSSTGSAMDIKQRLDELQQDLINLADKLSPELSRTRPSDLQRGAPAWSSSIQSSSQATSSSAGGRTKFTPSMWKYGLRVWSSEMQAYGTLLNRNPGTAEKGPLIPISWEKGRWGKEYYFERDASNWDLYLA